MTKSTTVVALAVTVLVFALVIADSVQGEAAADGLPVYLWLDADGDGVFGSPGDILVDEGKTDRRGRYSLKAPKVNGDLGVVIHVPPTWGSESDDVCGTVITH